MGIRSTAKAIIVQDGKVLLNLCNDPSHHVYYSLPGGGQNQEKTMEEAVVRECLEETGYHVKPIRFAALTELIFTDPDYRQKYPDYTHRVFHVFICNLADENRQTPTETDSMQTGIEWVDISRLESVQILPRSIGENIVQILKSEHPVYLGAWEERYNHG